MLYHPFSPLRDYLLFVGLTALMLFIGYLRHIHQVMDGPQYFSDIDAADYKEELLAKEPLAPNAHIEALHFPEVKAKAQELARVYNRRVHIIDIAWARLSDLRRIGKLNMQTEAMVLRHLQAMHKDNERILANYEKIAKFAEEQSTLSFIRQNSPDEEERVRLFNEENTALLRELEEPIIFR